MSKVRSQNEQVLKYLQRGKQLTSWEAITMWGITRLSGRIYDLRQRGVKIVSTSIRKGSEHFSSYRIESHGTGCSK